MIVSGFYWLSMIINKLSKVISKLSKVNFDVYVIDFQKGLRAKQDWNEDKQNKKLKEFFEQYPRSRAIVSRGQLRCAKFATLCYSEF